MGHVIDRDRDADLGVDCAFVGLFHAGPEFREVAFPREMAGCSPLNGHPAGVMRRLLCILWLCAGVLHGAPLQVRVVAANLTSDNKQAYSPDNGNHSNPEGAGARILKALKPDVVLIQEFNTTVPQRQWVNQTFGPEFFFMREEGMQIPNGIISRFPIIESGSWDDPVLDNRDFAWAHLRLPGQRNLWVVSVHLHSKSETSRVKQATALREFVRGKVPKDALLVIGGDLNTRRTNEKCFPVLAGVVEIPATPAADGGGIIHTNAPRNRPYDWVLASKVLHAVEIPVRLAEKEFAHGLVFDSRVFEPLGKLAPVQKGDSGVPFMQHMAVVRDFRIP
jgi:endonuclease/exonuclease/phosphatase family metal-dependent hydrolase